MSDQTSKSIGQAIDEIVNALSSIDQKSRSTVVKAVCELLDIDLPLMKPLQPSILQNPVAVTPPLQEENSSKFQPITDIRSLKDRKQPSNSQEMACLIAYYLQELAPTDVRKNDVNTDDLDKYFKQADFPLPKKMRQVLIDAKASGYFDSVDRGKYKLNPVGYNLAAHGLPRKTTSK